jgi:hypothetical protein
LGWQHCFHRTGTLQCEPYTFQILILKTNFLKFYTHQRMIRRFPAILQNRRNVILFHETIPLKRNTVSIDKRFVGFWFRKTIKKTANVIPFFPACCLRVIVADLWYSFFGSLFIFVFWNSDKSKYKLLLLNRINATSIFRAFLTKKNSETVVLLRMYH